MPPAGPRDLRDLTRDRTKLVQERGREVNRVYGVLERPNIKLGPGATHIFGVSGRVGPATMAEVAMGLLRNKVRLLEQALTGLVRG